MASREEEIERLLLLLSPSARRVQQQAARGVASVTRQRS